MSGILDQLRTLSTAEDFFTTLDVPFDPQVVNVSRLHILKRFQAYLRQYGVDGLPEAERKAACQTCLTRAHQDFTTKSGVSEKMFKVFKDQEPAAPAFVSLQTLRAPRG